MFPNYSRIRLMTAKFEAQGARPFDVGYIIETYPNGDYEVEFSDAAGITTAQIVACEEDIQLADTAPQGFTDLADFQASEAPTLGDSVTTVQDD